MRTSSSVSASSRCDRRPVVGVGRDDDDVAVQAHLLAVVLADVRVVPVDAGVGERDACACSAPPTGIGVLRLVRAVVAVVQPQPVPVHRRLQVALVVDVDDDLRALRAPAASGRGSSRCRRASAPSRRRCAWSPARCAARSGHRRPARPPRWRTPPAGRRCRAGTRLSKRSSRLLAGFGRGEASQPSTALEDAREGQSGEVGGTWARGRPWADPTLGQGWRRKVRHPTWRAPVGLLGYAVSVPCGPGLATAPRTVATNAASARSVGNRPARSSALPACTSARSIEQVPSGGHVRAEGALGLAAFDEREQPREHRAVAVAELLGCLRAGVDGDERVVAPERAPRGADHPRAARPRVRRARARPRR